MSPPPPRDPLLMIARLGSTVLMGLFAGAAAALLFAALLLLVVPSLLAGWLASGQVRSALAEAAPGLTPVMLSPAFLATIGALLVIVAAVLLAGFQFVRQLRRMIDSVDAGDPFTPANAARLTEMAWLLVAVELAALPLHALAEWIGAHARSGDLTVEMDVSAGNLFVALVLFILARVFREGTRLRDEVEGTV